MSEPLVWIGSFARDGGAERVLAAFDLVCTYDDPTAELVMAGPAPDPRHLAALERYRAELKLHNVQVPRRSVACGAPRAPRPRAGVAVG